MFEQALAASIPIIGVHTDDLVNYQRVLEFHSKMKVLPYPAHKTAALSAALYYTDDLDHVTVEAYTKLMTTEHQLVVLNPAKKHSLIFDAGELPTPKAMIIAYLKTFVPDPMALEKLYKTVKGFSVKTTSEIISLTMARSGGVAAAEVKKTIMMIHGQTKGLYPIEDTGEFYAMPAPLQFYLDVNREYFNVESNWKLVPRGVLLEGTPGVGKSAAAVALGRDYGCPVFRLDIATTLDRWLGNSEAALARNLHEVEENAPCVLLIDEVEKLFGVDNEGTNQRLLGQLLWWLQERRVPVLVVMTTNNKATLPVELYRRGRLDAEFIIPKLKGSEQINDFLSRLLDALKVPVTQAILDSVQSIAAPFKSEYSHGDLTQIIYMALKQNNVQLP